MRKIYLALILASLPVMAWAQNSVTVDVSTLPPGWIEWVKGILATASVFIAGFAAIAAVLPKATDTSPTWWKYLRGVIDFVAINFGNAKNAA